MKVIIIPRKWLKNCFLLPLSVGERCRCQRLSDIISYQANGWTLMNIHLSCEPKPDAGNQAPPCPQLLLWSGKLFVSSSQNLAPPAWMLTDTSFQSPCGSTSKDSFPGNQPSRTPSCVWSLAPLPAASSPSPQQGLVIKPQKKQQPERAGRTAGTKDSCALTVWLFPSKLFFVVGR